MVRSGASVPDASVRASRLARRTGRGSRSERPPRTSPRHASPSTQGGSDTYYVGWFGFDTIPELVEGPGGQQAHHRRRRRRPALARRRRRRLAPGRHGQPEPAVPEGPPRRGEGREPGCARARRAVGRCLGLAPRERGRQRHELPIPAGGDRAHQRRDPRSRRQHRGADAVGVRVADAERAGGLPAGRLQRPAQPRRQPRHDPDPVDDDAGRRERRSQGRSRGARRGQGQGPRGRGPAAVLAGHGLDLLRRRGRPVRPGRPRRSPAVSVGRTRTPTCGPSTGPSRACAATTLRCARATCAFLARRRQGRHPGIRADDADRGGRHRDEPPAPPRRTSRSTFATSSRTARCCRTRSAARPRPCTTARSSSALQRAAAPCCSRRRAPT